ncbi:unnamed protein product [Prunus brigantina]
MCRPSQTPHPTMSSARIGRREAGLGSKKRGDAPPPFHGIIGFPLSVPVPRRLFDARGKSPKERSRPSPGRHAATRSRRGSSSSSPPTADGFGTGTPVPSPSQPILFPRLRIHFADFPCLHCSIDRRLFTLETRCGYEFGGLLATSRAANHPRRRDPNTSPDHSIGRSDGRCHSNFFKVTKTGGTTRPIKARSVSPVEGTSRPVHTRGGPVDPTQGPTTSFLTATTLIYAIGAGITAAAAPDLPSNGSSPVLLFIVTTSPCRDWVICAPAAFLGCGSRFSVLPLRNRTLILRHPSPPW